MSTILDALRRADAERQRGQAPSREAVTRLAPPPAAGDERGRRPLLLLASLGGALLAGALAWALWPAPSPAPQQAASPPPPAPSPGVARPAPAETLEPPARPPGTVAGAGVGFQALPFELPPAPPPAVPRAAPPIRPPGEVADAPPRLANRPSPRPPASRPRGAEADDPAARPGARAAVPPAPVADSAPAPSPVPRPLREQPAGLQAALQGQRIDGVVHAEDPASRLLIVNGQIRHEGEPVAEGVRIERIEPGAVLLRWQGGVHALRP